KFVHLPVIKQLIRFFKHPLIALALFNSLFAICHLPTIFDFTKSYQIAHDGLTVILFVLALFMWWPIVTPLKKHDKVNPLIKMAYLLGSILIISIACALLIFSSNPLYNAYTSEGAWMQALSLCVPAGVLDGLSGTL